MSISSRVASTSPYRLVIGAGLALTMAALSAGASARRSAVSAPWTATRAPIAAKVAVEAPVAAKAPIEPVVTPPAVHSNELLFVFAAGAATYVKLADLAPPDRDDGLAMPRHGKVRYSHGDDGVHAAVALVSGRNVPAAYAAWQGKKLKVDNTCEATIVGFAVVSRLIGDPGYADHNGWDAAEVMHDGHQVLAARLDGCTGTFARSAALPDVVIPTKLHDAVLEQAAIEAVIASAPARDTERGWREQGTPDRAVVPWREAGNVTAEVIRHPGTGEIFVSAHAHISGGCGDPEANVWGLFRVVDGKLVTAQLRQLGDMRTIDMLLDVDGNGELELLGQPWLGNAELLTHTNGDAIDDLSMPFVGCPC